MLSETYCSPVLLFMIFERYEKINCIVTRELEKWFFPYTRDDWVHLDVRRSIAESSYLAVKSVNTSRYVSHGDGVGGGNRVNYIKYLGKKNKIND